MPDFLVTIYRDNGYDAFAQEDKAMHQDIDDINDEMVAAGVRVFVGGLYPHQKTMSIDRAEDGSLCTRRGLYLETTEHVGGLWVVSAGTMEEALEWGRKAAKACRASVEVRQFH